MRYIVKILSVWTVFVLGNGSCSIRSGSTGSYENDDLNHRIIVKEIMTKAKIKKRL